MPSGCRLNSRGSPCWADSKAAAEMWMEERNASHWSSAATTSSGGQFQKPTNVKSPGTGSWLSGEGAEKPALPQLCSSRGCPKEALCLWLPLHPSTSGPLGDWGRLTLLAGADR